MSNAIVPVVPKRNAVTGAGYPTSLALGELAVNTTTGNIYLGADPGVVQIGIPVVAGTTLNLGTGDGSTVAFTITGGTGTDAGGYLVSVGGIDQPSGWTVAGTTLTFSEAPPTGAAVSVRAILKGEGGGGESGNATSLQSKEISTTVPTNNELLQWDEFTQKWNPNNNTLFGRNPSGTADGVAIGVAVATDTKSVSIGWGSKAFNDGVAFGNNAQASPNDIGGLPSISIGKNSKANYGGIAIGDGAESIGELSISCANATTNAPVDGATVVNWLKITINGTGYFLPLYQ
jgi:hypothetical protein